jgi:hypothetical protein
LQDDCIIIEDDEPFVIDDSEPIVIDDTIEDDEPIVIDDSEPIVIDDTQNADTPATYAVIQDYIALSDTQSNFNTTHSISFIAGNYSPIDVGKFDSDFDEDVIFANLKKGNFITNNSPDYDGDGDDDATQNTKTSSQLYRCAFNDDSEDDGIYLNPLQQGQEIIPKYLYLSMLDDCNK